LIIYQLTATMAPILDSPAICLLSQVILHDIGGKRVEVPNENIPDLSQPCEKRVCWTLLGKLPAFRETELFKSSVRTSVSAQAHE
jgi:hypothetical protein